MENTMTAAKKTARADKIATNKAHVARMEALRSAARAIVATGKCPDCGAGIHRNITIAGWWQCDRSGSASFRRDNTGAHCSFQTFTE